MRIPSTTLRKGTVDKGVGVLSWLLQERGGESTHTLVPLTPHSLPPASAGAAVEHRTREEQRQAAPEKDF